MNCAFVVNIERHNLKQL